MARNVDGLGKLFEDIAAATTIRELIDLGYLVDVDIYGPSEPDLSGVKIVAGDYHEKQLAEAVDRPTLIGDIVTHWHRASRRTGRRSCSPRPSRTRSTSSSSSTHGRAAEHIDAYTDDEDRRRDPQALQQRHDARASNCSVLAEGGTARRAK
jgi:DNA repair protein RadD